MVRRSSTIATALVFFTLIAVFAPPIPLFADTLQGKDGETNPKVAGLEECLQNAMRNNRRRPASRFAVEMAEAQHRQALAGYWPQVGLKGGCQLIDEDPNFVFPASSISLPMGGGIPLEIPGAGTVSVGTINVPGQDVKLMDKESFRAQLEASWLLYDGGMRKGFREQTAGLVDMMKQESRRTDMEIADGVKRLYYGAVLAARLRRVGDDTLARMEATLELTETMYKEGSGKVKKTDWLDNKIVVESLRSMVALLERNESMSQAALANTMGLPWNSSVKPADEEIPFLPFQAELDDLVGTAYRFNPDWAKTEAGVRAAQGAVRSADSGHYPKLALVGELHKWWNDYEEGIATDRNKEGYSVGVGVEIPLFEGFLTKNKVAEARARHAKIMEEQLLLKDGIGLRIRDIFFSLNAAEKSHRATLAAMDAAVENRDLNIRAYRHELVETEDVIRAQLTEALMTAQHCKTSYDRVALQSQLALVVGTEVLKSFEER